MLKNAQVSRWAPRLIQISDRSVKISITLQWIRLAESLSAAQIIVPTYYCRILITLVTGAISRVGVAPDRCELHRLNNRYSFHVENFFSYNRIDPSK